MPISLISQVLLSLISGADFMVINPAVLEIIGVCGSFDQKKQTLSIVKSQCREIPVVFDKFSTHVNLELEMIDELHTLNSKSRINSYQKHVDEIAQTVLPPRYIE